MLLACLLAVVRSINEWNILCNPVDLCEGGQTDLYLREVGDILGQEVNSILPGEKAGPCVLGPGTTEGHIVTIMGYRRFCLGEPFHKSI
jgi:hypothetical protein